MKHGLVLPTHIPPPLCAWPKESHEAYSPPTSKGSLLVFGPHPQSLPLGLHLEQRIAFTTPYPACGIHWRNKHNSTWRMCVLPCWRHSWWSRGSMEPSSCSLLWMQRTVTGSEAAETRYIGQSQHQAFEATTQHDSRRGLLRFDTRCGDLTIGGGLARVNLAQMASRQSIPRVLLQLRHLNSCGSQQLWPGQLEAMFTLAQVI